MSKVSMLCMCLKTGYVTFLFLFPHTSMLCLTDTPPPNTMWRQTRFRTLAHVFICLLNSTAEAATQSCFVFHFLTHPCLQQSAPPHEKLTFCTINVSSVSSLTRPSHESPAADEQLWCSPDQLNSWMFSINTGGGGICFHTYKRQN